MEPFHNSIITQWNSATKWQKHLTEWNTNTIMGLWLNVKTQKFNNTMKTCHNRTIHDTFQLFYNDTIIWTQLHNNIEPLPYTIALCHYCAMILKNCAITQFHHEHDTLAPWHSTNHDAVATWNSTNHDIVAPWQHESWHSDTMTAWIMT